MVRWQNRYDDPPFSNNPPSFSTVDGTKKNCSRYRYGGGGPDLALNGRGVNYGGQLPVDAVSRLGPETVPLSQFYNEEENGNRGLSTTTKTTIAPRGSSEIAPSGELRRIGRRMEEGSGGEPIEAEEGKEVRREKKGKKMLLRVHRISVWIR